MKNIFNSSGFNPMHSKGRAVLHNEILPKIASFYKSGDTIVNIGTHIFWDYKSYFFNPVRFCNYITTDIRPGLTDQQTGEPLDYMVDDICHSKMESNSVDCVICIGIHDEVTEPELLYPEVYRILKPGGRIMVAFPGTGANVVGRWIGLTEWADFLKQFIVDDVHYVYDPENEERYSDGRNTAIMVIARKPKNG
jgi:SAM-dependent methyltransferase